jgi:hypothetical protein
MQLGVHCIVSRAENTVLGIRHANNVALTSPAGDSRYSSLADWGHGV